MRRFLSAAIFATFALSCLAQDVYSAKLADRTTLSQSLTFEGEQTSVAPADWGGGPDGTLFVDGKIVHSGRWAARIERHADSPGEFSSLHKAIAVDFAGKTIELRGFLRTEDLSDFAGLWLREDGETPGLVFDNMRTRGPRGTTGWTEYSIQLRLDPEAKQVFFGVLVTGTGRVWADDLQLLVDGKPVSDLPKIERPKTALELDHKYDGGSGIALNDLTKIQTENLAWLGKVWGFLKYHHPLVVSGQRHWDYELFRVLPSILKAPDRTAANTVLFQWINRLGPVAPCHPCARLNEKALHFRPDVGWINDEALLGADLSRSLQSIYRNRSANHSQFYVSLAKQVGNPSFTHELAYDKIKFPDAGYQILGLFRFWNIIEYWFPYRDVLGENWDKVLSEFVPRLAFAKDSESYQRELFALIARAHDTHANLWSSFKVRPPVGDCALPVKLRFVENYPVVSGYSDADAAKESGLMTGDSLIEIDGQPVTKLVESWQTYYAGSNDAARFRDIAASMTRGNCGESSIHVLRENQEVKLKPKRIAPGKNPSFTTHDLPGPTFRLLSKEVAYLKLSSVKAGDAAHYIEDAAGTKGLIIDIRNYPSEFMVFALGQLLVEHKTEFARFTEGDVSAPGAFHWTVTLSLSPRKPHYSGKVVILVDEVSQSQAEYTTMAFRVAPQAIVVGSTTAGADGNVSAFSLPGGWRSMVSGIGVFYPDKKPTQRVGIVPNVTVRPTIAGIRAGRDEVLEEALHQILGPEVSAAQIQGLLKK
jgi:C-terminal processing protease CtpA/Prc